MVNAPGDEVARRLLTRIDSRTGETDTLAVVLFKPKLVANDEWVCEYSIESVASATRRRSIFGVDAMQALILSLRTIRAELDALRSKGAELTWLGESDLGLQ